MNNPASKGSSADASAMLFDLLMGSGLGGPMLKKQMLDAGGLYGFHYDDVTVTINMSKSEFIQRQKRIKAKYANFNSSKKEEGDRLKREILDTRKGHREGQHLTFAVEGKTVMGPDNYLVADNIMSLIEIKQMPPSGEHYGIEAIFIKKDKHGNERAVKEEIY